MKKSIILLIVFVLMSFDALASMPFKSKTDDECVKELACAWHHFVLATKVPTPTKSLPKESGARQWPTKLNVRKWEKTLILKEDDSLDLVSYETIQNYYTQTWPFIPLRIQEAEGSSWNHLIAITDDNETYISENLDGWAKKQFGKNLILDAYKAASERRDTSCYYLHIQDPNNSNQMDAFVAFIDEGHPNIEECLREVIYAGYGLSNVPDSIIWNKFKSTADYSKTEILTLRMLMDPSVGIRSGMNFETARKFYETAYPKMMERIERNGGFYDYR